MFKELLFLSGDKSIIYCSTSGKMAVFQAHLLFKYAYVYI